MSTWFSMSRLTVWALTVMSCIAIHALAQGPDVIHQLYLLDTGLVSRSISFENPSGARAKAARRLATWVPAARARRHGVSSLAKSYRSATSKVPARSATSG